MRLYLPNVRLLSLHKKFVLIKLKDKMPTDLHTLAKTLIRIIAFCFILPLVSSYWILKLLTKDERLFQCFSQIISIFPGLPGEYLRSEFYALTMKRCSPYARISFGTIFITPETEIGKHAYIGAYCIIGKSIIGEDSLIASRVSIVSGQKQHNFNSLEIPIRNQGGEPQTISIGRDCWIGESALIANHIGDQAIIGTGSVVVKQVEPRSICVGNPAKEIAKRGS
jgi:virginiamycin A acetyltransferase